MAQRLEENTAKLTAARYEARNLTRTLVDCSDQLVTTKRHLHTTEKQLQDADEFLISFGKEYIRDSAGESIRRNTTTSDRKCRQELAEARSDLQTQKMTVQSCSSHLAQEREVKLSASATAEECSVQRTWLQREVEEYRALFSRGAVEKVETTGVRNRGDNRHLPSADSSKVLKDSHLAETESGKGETADAVNTESSRCIQRLAEERAHLNAQEMTLKNCTRNLVQERQERFLAFDSTQECVRELNKSQHIAKFKTAALTQCEYQLKEAQHNFKNISEVLKMCEKELSSRSRAAVDWKKQARECQGDPTKLTKCNEKLASASDTLRWKTQRLDECAENLVKTRGKVQKLKNVLAESESIQETIIENLNIRHQKELHDIVESLHRRHNDELQKTTVDCALHQIWDPIYKWTSVILLMLVTFSFLLPLTVHLFLLLAHFVANTFGPLLGIRGRRVEFGVNFRNRWQPRR